MMIRYQINQSLKLKTSNHSYIISYQDEDIYQYLVQQICDFHQLQEHVHLDIAQIADWQKFSELTQNYELFATQKAYEIQLSKTALNCKSLPELRPLDGDVFIFKTSVFKHKLLDEISKNTACIWIQSYAPKTSELWQWLSQKIQLDVNIREWFLQQPQLNFSQCKQALEKIKLSETQQLSLTDFKNHLSFTSLDENWTPLLEAWMHGNQRKAVDLLRESKLAHHELTLLVWLLGRNLQVLYTLKQALRPAQDIFASYKIWPQQVALFHKGLTHFSHTQLSRLLSLIQDIDVSLKSGKVAHTWLKLEQFLLLS